MGAPHRRHHVDHRRHRRRLTADQDATPALSLLASLPPHRCFYFRPGFLGRCPYCEGAPHGDDEEEEDAEENDDEMEAQMAREGYWAF